MDVEAKASSATGNGSESLNSNVFWVIYIVNTKDFYVQPPLSLPTPTPVALPARSHGATSYRIDRAGGVHITADGDPFPGSIQLWSLAGVRLLGEASRVGEVGFEVD